MNGIGQSLTIKIKAKQPGHVLSLTCMRVLLKFVPIFVITRHPVWTWNSFKTQVNDQNSPKFLVCLIIHVGSSKSKFTDQKWCVKKISIQLTTRPKAEISMDTIRINTLSEFCKRYLFMISIYRPKIHNFIRDYRE